MNLGMWGPRFKQAKPESNWFNLPSLWIEGFDSNGQKSEETAERRSNNYLWRYGLPYSMLLASFHLLIRSLAMKKAMLSKRVAVRGMLPFFLSLVVLKSIRMFSARRQRGWLSKNGTAQLTSVLAVLMSIVAYVIR